MPQRLDLFSVAMLLLGFELPVDEIAKIAILFIMAKKDPVSNQALLKVDQLPPVTATALKNSTANVLDQVTARGAIAITRHDKPRAVLLSLEQYERIMGGGGDWLAELHQEYRGMLGKMQEPAQKAAAKRAFNATPEELGEAAVAASTHWK
ncbi:MAG: type II toxin-antitoxin system Phd/YefM family antitoxin [Opitutales bacterium]